MTDKAGVAALRLTVNNVLGIETADIKFGPAGEVTIFGGDNGEGKTSLFDAFRAAIAGMSGMSDMAKKPIRDGAESGSVEVTLDGDTLASGPWIVRRTFTKGGASRVTITNSDGAKYPSAQAMLNRFIGSLTLDPLAFMRLTGKAQIDALLDVVDVGIDLDENADARALASHNRTLVNRDVKALNAQLDGMPNPGDDVPDEEVDIGGLLLDIDSASRHNSENDECRRDYRNAACVVDVGAKECVAAESAVADAERALAAAKQILSDANGFAATDRRALTGAKAAADKCVDIDTAALTARVTEAGQVNVKVRQNQALAEKRREAIAAAGESDALTSEITMLDSEKRAALAATDFPVPGMGLDDNGITFGGIPLSLRSSAERLKISLALAIAQSPELRVVLIRDGSLLDKKSMATVAAMAEEHGIGIWVERVGDADEGAVIMAAGRVRGAEEATDAD